MNKTLALLVAGAGLVAAPALAQDNTAPGGFYVGAIGGYEGIDVESGDGAVTADADSAVYGINAGYDLSLGSAFADVPSVAGLASKDAQSLLERKGFVPTKRYAPSTEIAPWHAIETEPGSGTRVKRPAHVRVTISTGPPRVPVPTIDDLAAPDARKTIEDAGFEVRVELLLGDGERLWAQVTRDEADRLKLTGGSLVFVRPSRTRVFAGGAG